MTTLELLAQLRTDDIRLWVEDGKLRYNAPPGALTPTLRAAIGARKAEILALLQEAQHSAGIADDPILPAPRDQALPLSFAQQRLWFLDQLEPGLPTYNLPAAVRMRGTLDGNALQRSLNQIVQRHEVLRTTFTRAQEQPVQVIAPVLTLPLPTIDLRQHAPGEREPAALRLALEDARAPFDLAHGPLIRATLLRLHPEGTRHEHILLLNMHHIVSDGWSLGVLIQELLTLYANAAAGQPASTTGLLPVLPVQYADFAVWQREWLQGRRLEEQLEYWRRQLGGRRSVLELPTDHPRPAVQSYRGAYQTHQFSPALTDAIKSFSQREGVTFFMTLLAAFNTLLYRYTGQADLLVGTPIANRTRPEIEGLIGCFVNTLVLRTDLGGNPSFQDVLERVRKTTLDAYAHQDVPFEKLVEELQPERNISHAPLFQVLFILQNAPMPALALPDLSMSLMEIERGTANFDLTLSLEESPHGLLGKLEYNTDLFEPATIQRMLSHFQTIVESCVAHPGQPITTLRILPEDERRQLVQGWNDTARSYPHQQGIHNLIAARTEQNPDAIAVCCENTTLTYEQLNRRANQLAGFLRRLGVGPDVLVGLCTDRSVEMLVGLLGILKAGGAYLPLDPAYPPERLRFMLQDSQAPVLLTQQRLLADLPQTVAQIVQLDTDWPVIAQEPSDNPDDHILPDNLAYMIYTSGSTGIPKGVQIPHRALVNHIHSMSAAPGLTEEDTLIAVTTLSFDIAALEMFLPLSVGARLELVSRAVAADGTQLRQALARSGATVMQATPATWRMLLAAGWQSSPHLKLLCGGEALPQDLADRLTAGGAELWNMYGPTETTIWSAIAQVSSGAERIALGQPIANTTLYLLDNHWQPVPIGVPGELYIGGLGLARGYHQRPDLTAERFIPDPFSAAPNARLYRTGDRARYRADGTLEYLGRIDHQVKLRGFRIELGEIEATLSRHPAVRQAAVVVREDQSADALAAQRLVAYVVLAPEQTASVGELRAIVRERLPEYMTPSVIVFLAALPLTPNGKIDRKALPAPDSLRPDLETAYVLPRTGIEQTIAAVWQDVLQIERVGIHDSFFDLGGHSLLMVQVHTRLCAAFKHEFSMIELFKYPTVSSLAEYLRQIARSGNEAAPTDALAERLAEGKQRLKQRLRQRQPDVRTRTPVYADTPAGVDRT